MRDFRRFLVYVKPYRKSLYSFAIFTLFSTLFGLVSLTLIIPFLQIIFEKAQLPSAPPDFALNVKSLTDTAYYYIGQLMGEADKKALLLFLCIGIVILFLFKNLTIVAGVRSLAPMRAGVIHDLRKKMYDNLTRLPVGYYTEQRKGDIMTRMSSDVADIEWSIMTSIVSLLRDPVQILFTVVLLFMMSPALTLFVLILLPISAVIINRLGRSLKKATFQGQKFLSDLMVVIEETLAGIRIMKSFTAEKYLTKKFDHNNENFVRLGKSIFWKRSSSSPLSEFLGSIVISVVIWFGGSLVLNQHMEAELLIGYVAIFSQIISPAKAFSNSFYNVKTGMIMLNRIEEIVQAPNPITEKPEALTKKDFTGTIEFENVSFRYEQKPVLQEISLHIPKGKTIALVGQSGSGKSTMADLLSRFYDVESGSISIDGEDIRNLTLSSLRKLIGLVPQQSILFNDTVINNIAFGDETPDLDRVKKAAEMAHADAFIKEMENGYETMAGEQGGKLSGGQKQRIAIARALYKNAPILILDEATSALDNESEKMVQAALNNLMKDRTCIVIAHRLSTIQHADLIVVLEEGRIVEKGTHRELMARDGVYKKLYELSSSDIIVTDSVN